MKKWTIDDSRELYNINGWGTSYFGVNDKGAQIDLHVVLAGCYIHVALVVDTEVRGAPTVDVV